MKKLRKFLSVLLCLSLLLSLAPAVGAEPGAATTATLVTDVASLAVDDQIVIVANGYNLAMGAQSGNNCPAVSIEKSSNLNTISWASDAGVQVLTLKEGNTSGTWAFYTGSAYLCSASNSKNYLKTESSLSGNSSWIITIENGVATVKAQGDYSRNWMRYNPQNNIFACYGSGQEDIAIYKVDTSSSGSGESHTHTYNWTYNDDQHWKVCSCDENEIEAGSTADHSYDPTTFLCVCGKADLTTATVVTSPVSGTAYKFGLEQDNLKKSLYLNGKKDNYYFATTETAPHGADVYVEEVTGETSGYRLYFMSEPDSTKTYIRLYERSAGSAGVEFVTEAPDEVLTFDSDYNTFVLIVGSNKYFMGTYNSNVTISGSKYSYISSNFPAHLYTLAAHTHDYKLSADAEGHYMACDCGELMPATTKESHADTNSDYLCDEGCGWVLAPAADSTLTIPQANALGHAMSNDTYTEGKYKVTGIIESIDNTKFGNMYIQDADGNKLYIYGTYSDDGSTRYDKMGTKPVKGDTVTFYGIIGQYNGTAQIKNGWVTIGTRHTCVDVDPADCKCDNCEADMPHNYNNLKKDEDNHWYECSCGAVKEDSKAGHTFQWVDGTTEHVWTCECGATKACEGTMNWVTTDADQHWKTCSVSGCGFVSDKADHNMVTRYDETYHWTACVCGKTTAPQAHADGDDEDQLCDTCGYDLACHHTFKTNHDAENHWEECESCGYKQNEKPHSLTWKNVDGKHWQTCACGYETEKTDHAFTTPNHDATHHWNECVCGATNTKVTHTYSIPKHDATHHWNECSCGAQNTKVAHTYSIPKHDATHHWNECSCGYTTAKENHTLVDNKCVCGYEKQVNTPVYTKVDPTKVTEGSYIILGLSGTAMGDVNTAFMTTENATATRLMGAALTITNGTVTTANTYVVWNMIATEGGFYVQNAKTGEYLYYDQEAGGNKIYMTADKATAGVWKVVSHTYSSEGSENDGNTYYTLEEVASGRQLSANRFGKEGSYYMGFAAYANTSSTLRALEFFKLTSSNPGTGSGDNTNPGTGSGDNNNPGSGDNNNPGTGSGDNTSKDVISISNSLAGEKGTVYTVKGVVTLLDGQNVYIQDSTGAVCIRLSSKDHGIKMGDTIIATGKLDNYNGLPQLASASFEKSDGLHLYASKKAIDTLTAADVGKYINLNGVKIVEIYDNDGQYANPNITVEDANGNKIQIYKAVLGKKADGSWAFKVGDIVNINAAVSIYKDTLQLRNTYASEIVDSASVPATGDASLISVFVALMAVSGLGLTAVVAKKKEF